MQYNSRNFWFHNCAIAKEEVLKNKTNVVAPSRVTLGRWFTVPRKRIKASKYYDNLIAAK